MLGAVAQMWTDSAVVMMGVMLAVLWASGVDVMHREVRETQQAAGQERKHNVTDCIQNTHCLCLHCGLQNHFTATVVDQSVVY